MGLLIRHDRHTGRELKAAVVGESTAQGSGGAPAPRPPPSTARRWGPPMRWHRIAV